MNADKTTESNRRHPEEKYYSILSILLGVGSLAAAAIFFWGAGQDVKPGVRYGVVGLTGLWGAYQLLVEIMGPLVAFYPDKIEVRDLVRPRSVFVKWGDVMTVRTRGGNFYPWAVLVRRSGPDLEIPLFAIVNPGAARMLEKLRARITVQPSRGSGTGF